MKVAFFYVAVKSAPFIAADFQLDADLLQLFFERFGDAPAQIDVGGFEREAKTRQRAVAVGIS